MPSFYCENVCGSDSFSIEEWNKEFERCNSLGIEMEEPAPCKEQCFNCFAIVSERRDKTRNIKLKNERLMLTGVEQISLERQEQIEKHGRTIKKDAHENDDYELIRGAKALLFGRLADITPIGAFPPKWDVILCKKMRNKPYKERLKIAGALIAAEIDRIQFGEKPETK